MADTADMRPLSDILSVFDIEDPTERLAGIQTSVLPELRAIHKTADLALRDVYGDAWCDLFTKIDRPRPRNPESSRYDFGHADVGWGPRRIASRPYGTHNRTGRRAAILDVEMTLYADAECVAGRLRLWRRDEVGLLESLWNAQRDEVLALLEAACEEVEADIASPGPPVSTRAAQLDRLFRAGPEWISLYSLMRTRNATVDSLGGTAHWFFVCMFPILLSVTEIALGRHPSLRAMQDRLSAYLEDSGAEEGGEEAGPGIRVSSRLRYRILERDGFQCVLCGATAEEGARLEVDHILPIAKGGRASEDNLQVLCDRCNRGKGAALSPDLLHTTAERR